MCFAVALLGGCGGQTPPVEDSKDATAAKGDPVTAPKRSVAATCQSSTDPDDPAFQYVESRELGFRMNVLASAQVQCEGDRAMVAYEEGLARVVVRTRERCADPAQCLLDSAGGVMHGLAEQRGLPLPESLPPTTIGDDNRLAHCLALPFTSDGVAAVTLACTTGALMAGDEVLAHSVWFSLEKQAYDSNQEDAWVPILTLSSEWSVPDPTLGEILTGAPAQAPASTTLTP